MQEGVRAAGAVCCGRCVVRVRAVRVRTVRVRAVRVWCE